MRKKLWARHRALQIGATLVGAAALAVGFASPALAATGPGPTGVENQSVNNGNADNTLAQNSIIVQGGAQTSYALMENLSVLFNEAPGCDLASVSGSAQPLDYGCPGLSGEEGTAQAGASSETLANVTVTAGGKKLIIPAADTITTALQPGMEVYDSQGLIPVGDAITTMVKGPTKPKVLSAATGGSTTDSVTFVTVPQQGENGVTNWGQENPYNDGLFQEPSYGSSSGILELEGTGNSTTVGNSNGTLSPASTSTTTGLGPVNVSPLDAARAARAPSLSSTGDDRGLNFVAYAEDAVTDLYWTELNGSQTDAAKCLNAIGGNPTTAELKEIWNATWTSGVPFSGSTQLTWANVFGSNAGNCSNNNIYPYWAISGAGTESTWATATGAKFPVAASNWPSNEIIFENETTSILKNAATIPVGDVLFFYSYGNFNKVCTSTVTVGTPGADKSTNPLCAGTSTNTSPTAKPNQVALGTEANGIDLDQTDINNQLPGQEGNAYFADRLLYNVYSNGSNPLIPASSAAALNAISEDGFMCKPSTATDIDPNTGATYLSEIDGDITSQGFFPLPGLQDEDGQGDTIDPALYPNPGYYTTDSGIPHPAWTLGDTPAQGLEASQYNAANETTFNPVNQDTDNSAVNGTTYSNVEDGTSGHVSFTAEPTTPVGYCITLTTDSSSAGNGPG
jgi:hypothetical protein